MPSSLVSQQSDNPRKKSCAATHHTPGFGLPHTLAQLAANESSQTAVDLRGWAHVVPARLADSLRANTHLQSLSVSACHLGDDGVLALCAILQSGSGPPLKVLQLSSNNIGNIGAVALAAALAQHATLEELDLSWNVIADDGGVALAHVFPTLPRLRVLDLSGTLPGRGGGGNRRVLGRTDERMAARLNRTNLGAAAGVALSQALSQCTQLSRLVLSRQPQLHAVLPVLVQALADCPALQVLELSRCTVDDGTAMALASALQRPEGYPCLQVLKATLNRIDDPGAVALAAALSSPHCSDTLHDVRLTQSAMGVVGLQAWVRATAVNVHLSRLDVYGHEAGLKLGSALVWQIKPWLDLNRRTARLLMQSQAGGWSAALLPHLLHAVSSSSPNPTRFFHVLRGWSGH
jgi:Ran GTPase-activating protein (RanGAP) involved in mRNA processing and transport